LIRGLSPADDLTRVVSEEGADMIVIGLRRRSRTGKLLVGSNAQDILLNANCPVLAVKARY
jgi:nucleotide-binding universal stress UspA family protein